MPPAVSIRWMKIGGPRGPDRQSVYEFEPPEPTEAHLERLLGLLLLQPNVN